MIKILELFGGIGAPRKALVNLGIDHKAIDYVEIDEKAVRTYNALFACGYRPQDVVGWNLKPDILVHGSPCQDFSRAGTRLGGRDEDKTRSSLMWETLRIIENMGNWKPKIIIWENVKGVLDRDIRHSFEKYLKETERLGYKNSYKVLNAMDFGIPQKRERLFTISIYGNVKFNFDRLKKRELRPLSEFLEKEVDEKYVIKSPSMLKKIREDGKVGGRWLIPVKDFVYTITTKQDRCPNSGIIRLEDGRYRILTEKECWRLMGFDDEDFYKALAANPSREGKKNSTLYKQAGNSIVVQVLEAIFSEIIENPDYYGIYLDRTQQLAR